MCVFEHLNVFRVYEQSCVMPIIITRCWVWGVQPDVLPAWRYPHWYQIKILVTIKILVRRQPKSWVCMLDWISFRQPQYKELADSVILKWDIPGQRCKSWTNRDCILVVHDLESEAELEGTYVFLWRDRATVQMTACKDISMTCLTGTQLDNQED